MSPQHQLLGRSLRPDRREPGSGSPPFTYPGTEKVGMVRIRTRCDSRMVSPFLSVHSGKAQGEKPRARNSNKPQLLGRPSRPERPQLRKTSIHYALRGRQKTRSPSQGVHKIETCEITTNGLRTFLVLFGKGGWIFAFILCLLSCFHSIVINLLLIALLDL